MNNISDDLIALAEEDRRPHDRQDYLNNTMRENLSEDVFNFCADIFVPYFHENESFYRITNILSRELRYG